MLTEMPDGIKMQSLGFKVIGVLMLAIKSIPAEPLVANFGNFTPFSRFISTTNS